MTTAGLPAISNGASYEMRDIVAARVEKRTNSHHANKWVQTTTRLDRSIPKSRSAGRDFLSDKTIDTLTITPEALFARARSVN